VQFYGPGFAPGACSAQPGVNNMGTIMGQPSIQTDPVGCCAECQATSGCVGYTYVESSSECFLKSKLGSPVSDPGATSGGIAPPNANGAVDTTQVCAGRPCRARCVTCASPLLSTVWLLCRVTTTLTVTVVPPCAQPFTVVTQFITSDGTDSGDLVEITRFFVQNGKKIMSPAMSNIPAPYNNLSSITDSFCKAKTAAYQARVIWGGG
jgi:hypothetical protein